MGMKDVALISGLRILAYAFQPTERDDEPTFKEIFFSCFEIGQLSRDQLIHFWSKFLKRVSPGDEGD